MRTTSPEILKFAEAEPIPDGEGSMCVVAMRDSVAPPGSKAASRTNGHPWNPGGPAGSVETVNDGDAARGATGALRRAEAGSRTGSYYR